MLVGALAYERALSVVADVQEVGRGHAIVEGSDALLTRAVDAETGQRAYLLTGDETFLEPYTGARADIARSVDSLRRLVRGDPAQSARLTTIETLIPGRFALLDSAIQLRRQGAASAATSSSRLLAGKEKMDQLRSLVSDLQTQEKKVLAERRLAEQRSVRSALLAVGAAGIIALLISALINLAFSRALNERDSANTALRGVNQDLERQSEQLEMQAVEMESQAAELEATAEDLRSTNDALSLTTRTAEQARDAAETARLQLERVLIDNGQLYRSALAASDAKSAFLATMSHELRTPLNAIIGYQSLLAEGIDGILNASQLGQLARIRASADHLLGLIDEVLTFSRVDAGKEVVRRDEIQLGPIVAEALTMVTPLAEAKGLRLRNETTDARLLTDGGKVRQILLNLLSNAIKFSDDGDIVVRSRLNGESVAVSIADRGIGIAAENLEKIFDPFWQVEQRSTRRIGGTGLGLSVSRSLARLLGGEVSVESGLDQGSMFTLTLPARRGSSAPKNN